MSRSQRHSGGESNGLGRNGGGGGNRNSRENSQGNSTSGGAVPASPPQSYAYEPNRDPVYIRAPRSSRYDHAHMSRIINNRALDTAPMPSHPQNQESRSYNAPHQSWTDHSSTHLHISTYDASGSDFNASQAFQTPSTASISAQPNRQQYHPPIGGFHPNQAVDRHPGPYDAVGYIRRDGEVYDEDELYEEYRQYDPYAHQQGHRGNYASNGTSH